MKKTGFGGEVTHTVIVATVQVVVIAAVVARNPPSVIKSVIICRSLTTALLIVGAIACTVAVANLGAASITSSTTGMLMYSFPVLKVGLIFEMLLTSDVPPPPNLPMSPKNFARTEFR